MSLIKDNIQHVSVSQPTPWKMKKTILPFPICCCALVMVIQVSLGTAHSGLPDKTGPHCRDLALAQPATCCSRAGIFGYVGEARRGWLWFQRVSWFLEHTGWTGIGSDRTAHWNSPERLRPLAEGMGHLQMKCVWKVLHGLHLPTALPSSCSPLSTQCWYPNCSLRTVLLENSVKFCNIAVSLWVSVPYIFSAFVAKRFINSEGRCCGLAKKAWQLILSRANFPWPLLCLYPVSSKQHPWALGSSAK